MVSIRKKVLTMAYYNNDGINIYYEIEGEGPDLMVMHGFASNIENNWRGPRVTNALREENRLILMDIRGHGKSDKPVTPSQYGEKLLKDITGLMDHLTIEKANFLGYSMGAQLVLELLINHPRRVRSAILGGFVLPANGSSEAKILSNTISRAFRADSIGEINNGAGKMFRMFAESTGANLHALANLMEDSTAGERIIDSGKQLADELKKISVPVMTVVGSDDYFPGDRMALSNMIPRSCHFQIQGCDHMNLVLNSKFKMVVKAFLNMVSGRR
jgi:pimeloyl-ACP methyl ester carboxylesterase